MESATGFASSGSDAQSVACSPGASFSFLRAASCSGVSCDRAGAVNTTRISSAKRRLMRPIVLTVLQGGKKLDHVAQFGAREVLDLVLRHGGQADLARLDVGL